MFISLVQKSCFVSCVGKNTQGHVLLFLIKKDVLFSPSTSSIFFLSSSSSCKKRKEKLNQRMKVCSWSTGGAGWNDYREIKDKQKTNNRRIKTNKRRIKEDQSRAVSVWQMLLFLPGHFLPKRTETVTLSLFSVGMRRRWRTVCSEGQKHLLWTEKVLMTLTFSRKTSQLKESCERCCGRGFCLIFTCWTFFFLSPCVKHGGSHSWSRSVFMNSSMVSWLVGVSSNSFSLKTPKRNINNIEKTVSAG